MRSAEEPDSEERLDEFDALIRGYEPGDGGHGDDCPDPAPRRRGPLLPIASLVAVLLGVVGIGAGLLASSPDGSTRPSTASPGSAADPPSAQPSTARPSASQPPTSQPATAPATGIDPDWVTRVSAATGIPPRPLTAYAEAAARIAHEQPACGLGWNTLAGIGFVESEHGTIHGSRIAADGRAAPAIIGIALDGTSTNAIPDTDGGALDGDAVWDRAVGPMQFIPSSWAEWGSDGDGDGIADPQDIDDAAYAAGRYLCAAGGNLRNPQHWIDAVAAYNDTLDYNHRAAAAASAYAQASAQSAARSAAAG